MTRGGITIGLAVRDRRCVCGRFVGRQPSCACGATIIQGFSSLTILRSNRFTDSKQRTTS